MASSHSVAELSARMNMAITTVGLLLSAVFLIVVCGRLLCSRLRHVNTTDMLQTGRRSLGSSSIERSLQGLEPSTMAIFPTVKYSQQLFTSTEDNSCTVCLGDYKEKEVLRILPRCGHAFHVDCIDLWFRQHSSCPVCRISLRIFSQWARTSSPLISCSAKPRFLPGALPDSIFEQPRESRSMPGTVPSGCAIEGSGYSMAYAPAMVANKVGVQMAESSMPSCLDRLTKDKSVGNVEKHLNPQPNIHADCNFTTGTIVMTEKDPIEHRSTWDPHLAGTSSREGSNIESDMPTCRSESEQMRDGTICQTGHEKSSRGNFSESFEVPR